MHEHPGVSVGHRIRLSARLLWFSDAQHTTWFICCPSGTRRRSNPSPSVETLG
jgi:hypothetical protein